MELIWGIELRDVLLLVKQLGLAILGAACLWGFIFSIRDTRAKKHKSWIVDDWISIQVFTLFLIGTALASIAHFLLVPTGVVTAHEGISIQPTASEVSAAQPLNEIFFGILLLSTLVMILIRRWSEEKFSYTITPFYLVIFFLAFAMTSFSAWRGELDAEQSFFFMHGFHSLFTLGSVIVLDFLFLTSSRATLLKQHVYNLFPTISKVIWVGFSLDFASVFLISEYFEPSQKLLFTQTVVGILIINGTILSGPIARKMCASVTKGGKAIARHWRNAGNVAGAISIVSWMTITTLDFLPGLTLGYIQILGLYLGALVLALAGHFLFDSWESRHKLEV